MTRSRAMTAGSAALRLKSLISLSPATVHGVVFGFPHSTFTRSSDAIALAEVDALNIPIPIPAYV